MKKQISEHAHAAKLIRQELKKNGIKAKVRSSSYAGGSSIRIALNNELPAVADAIKRFADDFQMGNFNGMEDIYEYGSNEKGLPQVKYVFVENRMDDSIYQAAWDYVKSHWGDMDDAPESYNEAGSYVCRNGNGRDLVWREMSEVRGGFWKSYKPVVAA